jgi:flagellar hook-basal body complex protein FliE
MNPLSGLSLALNPQLRAELLKPAGVNAPPQALPAAELEKLCPSGAPAATPAAGAAGSSFSNVLGNMVQEVNAKQAAAGDAVSGLLSGQNVSLHQAMIAMEEASVSFQLMVEVRNKLLDSYQELMRMQV